MHISEKLKCSTGRNSKLKRNVILCLSAMLASFTILACSGPQSSKTIDQMNLNDGNYSGEASGKQGLVKVEISLAQGKITKITSQNTETQGLGDKAIDELSQKIVETQRLDLDAISGATISSHALLEATAQALQKAGAKEEDLATTKKDAATKQTDQSSNKSSEQAYTPYPNDQEAYPWDASPKEGLIKGDYYKAEERFRQGHMGIFELIKDADNNIAFVQFNETARPNYYLRLYQNQNKRNSEYNKTMKEKKGAAWIESVLLVEQQMLDKQSLVGDFDTVSGASNSIQQSMLPLAQKVSESLKPSSEFKGPRAYILNKKFEDDGLIGSLKLVVENKKIVDLHYDEFFPADPKEISFEANKKFHGLSKYDSIFYEEPSRIGFNVAMDALKEKVLSSQNLLDLEGLPAIEDSGDYKKAGYTKRNTAWDHYLDLAKSLLEELNKDGLL